MFGVLLKKDSPMIDKYHPEEDQSGILDDDGHQKYQMLIRMFNWLCCIGQIDIAFATSSLSRYTTCPCKGHLKRVLRVFGYLKKHNNCWFIVDSRNPIICGGSDALQRDYGVIFKDFYPDAAEESDVAVPEPLIDEIQVTAFVDSDHAHDRVTRHSITGLVILLGRTSIFFLSK